MLSKKVVIVEDDSMLATLSEMFLQQLGYTIVAVTKSGEEVLGQILHWQPDLVLMDIFLLGDIDGITTAAKIHEQYQVPIIYISSELDQFLINRLFHTPFYGYLRKPFTKEIIQQAIQRANHSAHVPFTIGQNPAEAPAYCILRQGRLDYLNPAARDFFHFHQSPGPLTDIFDTQSAATLTELADQVVENQRPTSRMQVSLTLVVNQAAPAAISMHPVFFNNSDATFVRFFTP